MKESFLPMSRPYITHQDIDAVCEVLRSGWITTGPKNAVFEQRFLEAVGNKHAIAVSSATAGMHLLLHAMDIGPGDEVITPSLNWVSTANLIRLRGASPVFVDVDRNTLMAAAQDMEPLITERTRLLLPVHFAGASLDLNRLRRLAQSHALPLVEDAAHAMGTCYRNETVGQHGTAIFSFHPTKNITTGEGGMVCTDNSALAERIRRLKSHGLEADAFDREVLGRTPQAQVVEPGYKYNLPDMNAALGICQLDRLGKINRRRTELAALYLELLSTVDEIEPLSLPNYPMHHAWHLFIIRLNIEQTGMSRDQFMLELRQKGIGTGLHFRAVHTQKYYRKTMPLAKDQLPNTVWNCERICSLPLFPGMSDKDVRHVVCTIKSLLLENPQ